MLSFVKEKSRTIQKESMRSLQLLKLLLFFNCINVAAQLGTSVSDKVSEYRKISIEEYISKAKAGWIGQMAGVGWGAPTEFKWKGEIIPEDDMPEWTPGMINQFNQDDIFVEMTFLRSLEKYGFDLDIRDAGIDFANSRYWTAHANYRGRDNLRGGIAPPWSGHPKYNEHADDIDYQIEADYAGLISPGMPAMAVGLGNIFGRLMNYGDGLYGGNFVAGMYAEAFFEDDVEKIILAGLKCIPEGSQYHQAITDVISQYHKHPGDWVKTWEFINQKYHLNPEYRKFSCGSGQPEFNIDAKINGTYIAMGMLYGKRDMDKTIIISTRCGQDSDCNPSNAAGIIATSMGYENLPQKYTDSLKYDIKFLSTNYNFRELINVSEKLARQAVKRMGGKIEQGSDGKEYFFIPVIEPDPGEPIQSWDSASAIEDVYFTDKEVSRISYPPNSGRNHITVWKTAGPFLRTGLTSVQLLDIAFDPEKDLNAATWEKMPFGNGSSIWIADLGMFYRLWRDNAVAYLVTEVYSSKDMEAMLYFGADEGVRIWLNGTVIAEKKERDGFEPDEKQVNINLSKGWNLLLVKSLQSSGSWQFASVICDPKGNPLDGLKYR
jgi:hypothetical protein